MLALSTMQDEQLENAFVNTVTRNFSIKKRWLDTHGNFDPMLSYSRKPDSGYGWEDVDIGARIYAAKGEIRYTSHAFSIHLTHENAMPPARQVKASAQNFHYLVNKHPFIRTAARHWYVDTADRIVSWADEIGETSPALEFLRNDIREPKRAIAPLHPVSAQAEAPLPHPDAPLARSASARNLQAAVRLHPADRNRNRVHQRVGLRPAAAARERPPRPGRERRSVRVRHGDRPFRRERALFRSQQRRARSRMGRYVPLVHGEHQAPDGRRLSRNGAVRRAVCGERRRHPPVRDLSVGGGRAAQRRWPT